MLKSGIRQYLFFCLILTLSGCAQLSDLNMTHILYSIGIQSEARHINSIKIKTDQLLNQNKTEVALSILQNEIDGGIPLAKFSQQYSRAMNQTLDQASEKLNQQQNMQAGMLFRTALTHYPTTDFLDKKINLTRDEISMEIDFCANRLLEAGLFAYRSGQLEEAINDWSKIRQFHPTYKASQQAIQTTRTQLKNLESLNKNQPENGT